MSEQRTAIENAPIIKRLEVLIAEKETTKADFYKGTGVSSATYAQWNANQYRPSQKKLQAMADYFGVTVDYLLTGEQKEKAPGPEAESYNNEEREAVNLFRQLPEEERRAYLELLRARVNPK